MPGFWLSRILHFSPEHVPIAGFLTCITFDVIQDHLESIPGLVAITGKSTPYSALPLESPLQIMYVSQSRLLVETDYPQWCGRTAPIHEHQEPAGLGVSSEEYVYIIFLPPLISPNSPQN